MKSRSDTHLKARVGYTDVQALAPIVSMLTFLES